MDKLLITEPVGKADLARGIPSCMNNGIRMCFANVRCVHMAADAVLKHDPRCTAAQMLVKYVHPDFDSMVKAFGDMKAEKAGRQLPEQIQ